MTKNECWSDTPVHSCIWKPGLKVRMNRKHRTTFERYDKFSNVPMP